MADETDMAERRRKKPDLEPSWLEILQAEFDQPYMVELRRFLVAEMRRSPVYPKGREIFNAFWLTPFADVKVVILGQDPYPAPKQAHGLCFSVRRGVSVPASLQNVYRELAADVGFEPPGHGELTHWANQGVLLLNTVLTVRHRAIRSHSGKGWERFTDRVIEELNGRRRGLVFVLWGRDAKSKIPMIDRNRHLILSSSHPSPRSADYGFFGSRPFSRINEHLIRIGRKTIQWQLPH